MKKVIYNDNNLTDDEIERSAKKVRGVVLNNKGQILVAKYAGMYILIGGSIDEGEDEITALRREIKEESGIVDLYFEDEQPFLEIESYDKNYYDRKFKRPINRKTNTKFYFVSTDKEIDLSKSELTEHEKSQDFKASFINPSVIEYMVSQNNTENEKNGFFTRELLTVLREFTKYRTEKNEIQK